MAFLRKSKRSLVGFVLGVAAAAMGTSVQAATPLGTEVSNTAEMTFDMGGRPVTVPTNEAVFQVVARPTPSTIEFFRYAPNVPDAVAVTLNGSDYETGSGFVPMGDTYTLGGTPIDTGAPVPLVPAETYLSGELLVVRITDLGQNGDPNLVETVIGTLSADNGDSVTLRFYESGPNTGAFYAYLPSTAAATGRDDGMLTAPRDARLTATYIDAFDATEVSIDTALVDPYGRVFDALTGELIDGAQVTLVNADTGAPAAVFGVDGVSPYPATLVTGETVTDGSGLVYELDPGEYLFPLIAPGNYRLDVIPPPSHQFPSAFEAGDFVGLPTAPFEISTASYGELFVVEGSGAISLDVPVDGGQSLTVRKQAGVAEAAIGDFVPFSVTVENGNNGALPLIIVDELPEALRYVEGSAALNGQPIDDPDISADGQQLTFNGARIPGGGSSTISYVIAIGAGAPDGDVINRATAVSPRGTPLSNTAEAVLSLREDLFRSRLTLVGRVVEDACDGDDPWARPLKDGTGVGGVRLYLETGEFVVTDEEGLYHFQGVTEGTHVVRIDPETLPQGYEPMVCEENTRYAGSATSQFVDVRGGTVWRANFYLKRTGEIAEETVEERFNPLTEYRAYDKAWLDRQDRGLSWVYPDNARTPSVPSINAGIKAPFGTEIRLVVNGERVKGEHAQETILSTTRDMGLFRWRGVDLVDGENLVRAEITHPDGRTETMDKVFWFVTDLDEARLVDDQSVLVADGRTNPVIAIRLEDANGRALNGGARLDIDIPTPYRLASEDEFDAVRPVDRPGVLVNEVSVDSDGIARVVLAPTLDSGRLRLQVPLSNGRLRDIEVYLQPEQRDWIVVGLAEGSLQLGDGDLETPGRGALFAKGMVRGDWLLTVAVDTAKRRGQIDRTVFNRIDPTAYYTLYGDRTFQDHDAESQYPVFVKLEKNSAMMMFGDFDTGLSDSELLRYNRRLSGFKADYVSDRIEATGFVSETNQRFQLDEIAADGTTGPYRLSDTPIVRNSEVLRIETRDRFRPDEIVEVSSLERDRDYEIDYLTGDVRLRAPAMATDLEFNPNVIVAEYETENSGERAISTGGRAAVRGFEGRVELGASLVRDEASDSRDSETVTAAGVDLVARINETTEVRVEAGTAVREGAGEDGGDVTANAVLVEAVHTTDRLGARAFLRQEDAAFGLGQTGSNTRALRRLGVEGDMLIHESVNPRTNEALVRGVRAGVIREEALETGERRDLGEVALQQISPSLSASVGFRAVSEALTDGERQSVLATADAQKAIPEMGLRLGVAHEAPIGTGRDEVSLFPERTILTADKDLFAGVTLNLRHEITTGANVTGTSTIAGVSASPWRGARLTAGLDELTQENGRRLASNVAVDQLVQLAPAWSASFGSANRSKLDGSDDIRTPFADDALSPLEPAPSPSQSPAGIEGFTSAYAGVGYLGDAAAGSARVEFRNTATQTRQTLSIGAGRELSEAFSFVGAARLENSDNAGTDERTDLEVRLGTSYRPRSEGMIVFDRFDVNVTDDPVAGQSIRFVNNLAINSRIGDAAQMSAFWGIKHASTELAGRRYDGWTNLLGGELRYDLTERVDVGLSGAVMHTGATDTSELSFGPSVGFSPKKNIWASVGYNIDGFYDEDFEAAEFTRQGLYFKFRLKFDEDTVSGLLDRISPQARVDGPSAG
ncbi:MAG: hypothetical protein AAFR41_03900 [Pseudomonadota bacterium]